MIIQNSSNVVVSTSEVLNMLINSRMGIIWVDLELFELN